MLRMARELGFTVQQSEGNSDTVTVEISLAPPTPTDAEWRLGETKDSQ